MSRTEFSSEMVRAAIRRGGLNWKPAGPLAVPAQLPRQVPPIRGASEATCKLPIDTIGAIGDNGGREGKLT